MYPGEYVQPLVRNTLVQCPVVSGYVTARLQAQDISTPPATSGLPSSVALLFENVGNTMFSVVVNQTNDRSVSGTRYKLDGFTGTAVSLVPGGQAGVTADTRMNYLEVYCTGTTVGQLRLQIASQRRWTEMGFSKDDPFYPPQLFQAKTIPGPLT
jgi:hypothetical protein